jgi:hypothetical protein
MKKFLLAPALAALVVFVFGAVYWISPLPYQALKRVADDAAAGEALAKIFPATGAYLVPGMYLDAVHHEALSKRGPLAEVHFQKEGMPAFDPKQLLRGYLYEFVFCLLLALLLEHSAAGFHCWGARVKFCAMLGLLFALGHYASVIWWNHSIGWETMGALYDFIALILAGLVLGKMLTPKVASAAASPATA